MAQIASPYGLRPVQLLGGLPFAGAIRSFPMTLNSAKAFFYGDPVALVAGQPTVLAASPITTVNANSPVGVFLGCEWQDPVRGFVNAQSFPPNGISNGATKVKFKILDCPTCVFMVQANGPVQLAAIGTNTDILGFGTGNSATGNSLVAADATTAVTPTLALKIVGFPDQPGSQVGDPFTDLLVIWNQNVHRWVAQAGF
jgi:hypothetical protein